MSLIKQKSGIWQIRFQYRGKKYQRSSGTRNKTKAGEIERKWRNELLDKHQLGAKDTINLYKAFDMFLDSKVGMKTYHDVSTIIRTLKRYFDDKLIHELSNKDLEHYVLTRKREGRANQTILHGIIQLRGCVNYMDRLDYQIPYLKYPKLKIQNQRVRSLSKDEEARLLAELDPNNPKYVSPIAGERSGLPLYKQRQDNLDLVLLLLDVGARYSEISRLKWEQVNLEDKTINLIRTKTNNQSILLLSKRCYEVLKRRYDERTSDVWVFTDKSGTNPRKHSTISIRRAIKNAGIENFRVHDLRHSCASRLVQNGLSLQETALVLGHKNISTTLRYSHLENAEVALKMKAVIDQYNKV